MDKERKKRHRPAWLDNVCRNRWPLMAYDVIIFAAVILLLLVVDNERKSFAADAVLVQTMLAGACIFGCRLIGEVYRQIWRYG